MGMEFDPRTIILKKKKNETIQNKPAELEAERNVTLEESKKILEGRNALSLKQADLAKKINLPIQTISKWEKGDAIFDKKIANKIGKVLNIKFSD